MKIAIHSADLDHERIDGTRVYLLHMLKNFALLDRKDSFFIYHQNNFNLQLAPPKFPNYLVKKLPFAFFWTQTRFAWQLFRDKPEVLWMPVHNMPIFRRKKLAAVVTIHDLAFKIFPQYFPKKDLVKLNRLSDLAIKNAQRIIAVSEATKKDILKFYPEIPTGKITVIHHGFDGEIFSHKASELEAQKVLTKYQLSDEQYLLYVGAIQPRKNLGVLIDAFEKLKKEKTKLKLVIAGAPAWQYEATLEKIAQSEFKQDIIITGSVPFADLAVLYQNAQAFVFPSLYEGFGIPVLEAMASGVPVILANNSSLPEVAGEAALYFDTQDANDLADCLARVLKDEALRSGMIEKGKRRATEFSWKKCARQTLDIILKK